MSHVGDTSNHTLNEVTPASNSRSGISSSFSEVGKSVSKKLKFNENGLPIGQNSAKASSRLGSLARTHIPICYRSWKEVDEKLKDLVWNVYKDEYPDVRDSQRGIHLKKAGLAWKKYKSSLRENLKGNDIIKWKEKIPQGIKSEDWEAFCDNEATPSQQELRKRNKAIKTSCERKSTHNTGRDGYARAAEKFEKENGHPPSRAEMWLYTHRKKDGSYAPHDQQFAEKVEMLLKVHKEKGEEETLDSGPIYETFGKDSRGRVRCIGSTVSRKAMLASSFAREMLKEVTIEQGDLQTNMDKLKEAMEGSLEGVKSTLTEFMNDLKSGNFTCAGHNIHTTSPTNATPTNLTTHAPSNTTPSFNDLILCEIQSHTGEIVGYGRKTQLGAVASVHGRPLRPREVRVVLDNIKVPDYPIWGGKQGPCTILEDVGIGGFMYWHDDYLPPRDDTQEQ